MARSPHITESNASIITLKDGTGLRYLAGIEPVNGIMPIAWDRNDALRIYRPGFADDLLPKLRKQIPTARLSLELVKCRELR